MKKLLLIGAALAAITFTASAQTNDIYDNIGALLGNLGLSSNPTNYAAVVFVGHSTSGNQLSTGFLVVENVNDNIGVNAGVDHLWYGGKVGSANIVAGGLTLKAACHPLTFLSADTNSWTHSFTATPFAIADVGTPLSGTGGADGGLASIVRGGVNLDIYNYKGWELGAGIDYGQRSGSGNYNGDWVDLSFSVRKGF